MKKMADTVITASAGTVADTLLGKHAGTVATLVAGGVPGMPPSCAAGLVAYPVASTAPAQTSRVGGMLSGAGGMPMIPTPGGVLVGAAKRRMHGEKQDSAIAAASVAGAPLYRCGTLEEATASMQAAQAGQQSHIGVGTILSATPQGMMITGAIAAAPMARSALSRFGGRFGRGQQSKESMSQDLQRGILRLKSARFVEGSDELAPGFEKDMAVLAEALQSTEGQFLLNVPAESDGSATPDAVLAKRRIDRTAAYLLAAGIPTTRVVARGVHPSGLEAKSGAPRVGEARVEILRMPKELAP
ncbi:MAG: hypothetical protein M3068_02435 [Gemmatimonadota bacterium]|nr:hypothetical protein [Gemmatimonadota bacterium]